MIIHPTPGFIRAVLTADGGLAKPGISRVGMEAITTITSMEIHAQLDYTLVTEVG